MTTPPLSPADLARLQALPMEVLVPGSLPEGFAVQAVDAEDDPEWGSSYRIRYAGTAGALIMVEGVTGGIGDPPSGQSQSEFTHPRLGAGTLEFYAPEEDEPVEFRSRWMQEREGGPAYAVAGRRLDPEQAGQVAGSLLVLE